MVDDGSDADLDKADVERWETLANLFTAVAHPVRVAILESLVVDEDRPLTEVADAFDYSRSAIQKHVETLERAEVMYRPEESGKTYALTPFGQYLGTLLVRDGDTLDEAMHRADEAENEAEEEFADVPLGDAAMKKAVAERKWELVGDNLEEELTGRISDIDEQR
ncbi:helix-turn-helix transcriptional regulator [Haloterrigena sp. SYSU A121-1]|uniref:Helix-turn-helix transcriptional regulator n=1 Tax=Haloterrigena gelatinilytica TaxID=2741724 RepID=A0A8J8GJE5_9EURY|nr:helix-turn-helix domain-containing protein [Haloterrigena gelatinilytica]NUB91103.1 helix-turn-helix transcriptional regulator [Haloterrigena gelatinilytica]